MNDPAKSRGRPWEEAIARLGKILIGLYAVAIWVLGAVHAVRIVYHDEHLPDWFRVFVGGILYAPGVFFVLGGIIVVVFYVIEPLEKAKTGD